MIQSPGEILSAADGLINSSYGLMIEARDALKIAAIAAYSVHYHCINTLLRRYGEAFRPPSNLPRRGDFFIAESGLGEARRLLRLLRRLNDVIMVYKQLLSFFFPLNGATNSLGGCNFGFTAIQ